MEGLKLEQLGLRVRPSPLLNTCAHKTLNNKLSLIIARKIQMLYFRNTSDEIQKHKFATYATKGFQGGGALSPRPPDQGLCF